MVRLVRKLSAIFTAVLLLLVVTAVVTMRGGAKPTRAAVQQADAGVKEYRLVAVGPDVKQEVQIAVGDMIRITPYSYPVIRRFLGARLDVQLEGDHVLEPIGQAAGISGKDGATGLSAFLFARERGVVNV